MTDFVQLPEPQKELIFPLMKAIEKRRTKRKWKKDSLSQQEISNILWVACGQTMEQTKRSKSRRTVPRDFCSPAGNGRGAQVHSILLTPYLPY